MSDAPLHLTPASPLWPIELTELEEPPSDLWLRGDAALLARAPRIAIVGSRSPTPYGESQAERFGAALARAGVAVVSGLARGVDQAAHRGALDAGGRTLAVLGSGVDRPWPTGPVTERMIEQGALLSEYAPGREPRRHHFPRRNRLIAALADGVLVVEAARASGSLITAHRANDLGRDVFCVPGRIDHPMARGTLRLMREGATPVGGPEELLADLYGWLGSGRADTPRRPEGQEVLAALEGETLVAEEVARRLGRPLGKVLTELTELELAGEITRSAGGRYGLSSSDSRSG